MYGYLCVTVIVSGEVRSRARGLPTVELLAKFVVVYEYLVPVTHNEPGPGQESRREWNTTRATRSKDRCYTYHVIII